MFARYLRRLPLWLLLPALCRADYSWNFPEPVTPIARDTLKIHNEFMLIITALFVVVFAIMIYSMINHRKRAGHAARQVPTGPKGGLQWFWALLPFGILLFIDFILMGIPRFHAIIEMETPRTRRTWCSRSRACSGSGSTNIPIPA